MVWFTALRYLIVSSGSLGRLAEKPHIITPHCPSKHFVNDFTKLKRRHIDPKTHIRVDTGFRSVSSRDILFYPFGQRHTKRETSSIVAFFNHSMYLRKLLSWRIHVTQAKVGKGLRPDYAA